jgi:hypothetical protein
MTWTLTWTQDIGALALALTTGRAMWLLLHPRHTKAVERVHLTR